MKHKRVLHIITEKKWRGGEQQVAYFIQESKKLSGYDIEHFVICPPHSHFADYCQKHKISHFTANLKNELNIFTSWKIRKIAKQLGINLFHAHSSKALGLALSSQFFQNTIPIIFSRRVAFKVKQTFFNRLKYNHPALKKIICVSQHALNSIKPVLKPNNQKYTVIYDAIDLARFENKSSATLRKEYAIEQTTCVVASIAAVEPEKDVPTFINTAELLLKTQLGQVSFFIIGEGTQLNTLKKEVTRRNLQDKIIFTGFIEDITKILADINIVVITSKQEGLCSTALEAFASKKPVVASQAPGISEIVTDETTGLTAPIGDARYFAAQISRLISDQNLANNLTSNAYNFVKANHPIEKITRDTLAVYFE